MGVLHWQRKRLQNVKNPNPTCTEWQAEPFRYFLYLLIFNIYFNFIDCSMTEAQECKDF